MEGPDAEGEWDPADFILATELRMPVKELYERVPNSEWLGWTAYFEWRKAMRDIHKDD